MIGHVAVAPAEVDPIRVERGAERAARIARRGWHEHAIETRLREDPRVGHTVEGDTAAETQIREPRFLTERTRDPDQRVLQHALDACRAVREPAPFRRLDV